MNPSKKYKNIVARYPDFVTKKEFCEICGIAPTTATALERSGKIPYEQEVDGLLHFHRIKLTDVIAYLSEKECWQAPDSHYVLTMRDFYEREFMDCPEVLRIHDVRRLTGYSKTCVTGWINRGRLKGVHHLNSFKITKANLIDLVVSPYYRSITRKSSTHIAAMKKFEAAYAPPQEEAYA